MFPGGIGSFEMIMLGVVAVLLFGSRLPEVARSLGQSYNQFRKGLDDIKSTFNEEVDAVHKEVPKIPDYRDVDDDQDEPSAPQFKPPAEG